MNACLLIDELLSTWIPSRDDSPENVSRRINARLGLERYIAGIEAEVRRLKSEVERLPARRAQPTVKTAPIGPTKHKKWGIIGIIDETDEEFAERSGRKIAEVES